MAKFFKWLLTTIFTTAITALIVWGVSEWFKARAKSNYQPIIENAIRDHQKGT